MCILLLSLLSYSYGVVPVEETGDFSLPNSLLAAMIGKGDEKEGEIEKEAMIEEKEKEGEEKKSSDGNDNADDKGREVSEEEKRGDRTKGQDDR